MESELSTVKTASGAAFSSTITLFSAVVYVPARLLRHHAKEQGLSLRADGYVPCDEVIRYLAPRFPGVSMDKLRTAVANCPKQRFQLTVDGGVNYIRASQGHTIKDVDDEKLLTLITDARTVPTAVHGTYLKFWESIKVRFGACSSIGATALVVTTRRRGLVGCGRTRRQASVVALETTFTSRSASRALATSSLARGLT